jgi:hypothetical protein
MKKLFGSAELKMKDCAIGVIFDKELPFWCVDHHADYRI